MDKNEIGADTGADVDAGNRVEGPQEAQEGALPVEDVNTSGLEEKALREADNGVREQKTASKVKKKHGKGVLIGFLVFLTLLGVGFGVTGMVLWWQEKEEVGKLRGQEPEVIEKTEVIRENGETITIETESEGENDKRIKELLTDLSSQVTEWTRIGYMDVLTVYDITDGFDGFLIYQPEGLYISVPLTKSYGLLVKSGEDLSSKVSNWLQGRGFVPYKPDDGHLYDYINYDTGILCGVGSQLILNCGHITWYDAEQAKFSNQIALESGYPEGGFLNFQTKDLNIKDSQYAPYQTMQNAVLNFMGLWYRVSPDAPWTWFTGAQSIVDCNEYNTDDLKKAYLGESCWNTDTQSEDVVKL